MCIVLMALLLALQYRKIIVVETQVVVKKRFPLSWEINMNEKPELFFERNTDWYDWLLQNHNTSNGIYLIFYKLELKVPTMRWEEAVIPI